MESGQRSCYLPADKDRAAMLSRRILLPNIVAADQFKNSRGHNGDVVSTTATGLKKFRRRAAQLMGPSE